jgi:plastocyanin
MYTMRRSPILSIPVPVLGVVASAGCGGGDGTTTTSSTTGQAVMTISADRQFVVASSVPPGAQVKVLNQHTSTHDVTADDGGFKTKLLGNGESDTLVAQAAGTYLFHCSRRPDLTGRLTVTGSPGARVLGAMTVGE